MKVALMMQDEWNQDEIALIESELGEVVGPWTAGVDVTVGLSRTPGGTRFYAWDRPFARGTKEESLNWWWSRSLEELIQEVKDVKS